MPLQVVGYGLRERPKIREALVRDGLDDIPVNRLIAVHRHVLESDRGTHSVALSLATDGHG